jgi:hypothetical protein
MRIFIAVCASVAKEPRLSLFLEDINRLNTEPTHDILYVTESMTVEPLEKLK